MIIYVYFLLFLLLAGGSSGVKPKKFEFSINEGNFEKILEKCNKGASTTIICASLSLALCAGMVVLMVIFGNGENDVFIFRPYLCAFVVSFASLYCLYLIFSNVGYANRNAEKLAEYLETRKRIRQDSIDRREMEEQALVSEFGQFGEKFTIGNTVDDGFYCFPETRVFYHRKRAVPYDHVIDVQTDSTEKMITEGHSASVTRTDAGAVLGRSLLGEAFAGDTGAVIGAMTSPTVTQEESIHCTRIEKNSYVILYLCDEEDKYMVIDCGKGGSKLAHSIMLTVRDALKSSQIAVNLMK